MHYRLNESLFDKLKNWISAPNRYS